MQAAVSLSPIHVEAVGLSNVRFFAPLASASEFPWPSLDDLFAAVSLDRRMRRVFRADLDNSPWAGSTRRILTSDGRTLIAQHFVAQGLLDAWAQVGRCSPSLYAVYAKGSARALSKLTDGMSFADTMAYARDALAIGKGAT